MKTAGKKRGLWGGGGVFFEFFSCYGTVIIPCTKAIHGNLRGIIKSSSYSSLDKWEQGKKCMKKQVQ